MKSTIKVSISSIAFNLEEDAYQLLKNYLDELTLHFGKRESGREIIEDIEARLAELLLAKITTPEQAITVKDVGEVIDVLGKPEELNDGEKTGTGTESIPPYASVSTAKKRLYRDPDNQIISGVCGGLGVYFNIDPIIFRIIFVVLTLSGSFFWPFNLGSIAAITYIVLWICLPKALTMAQKLELRGESPSVANIERKVREEAMKTPAQANSKQNIFARLIKIGFYTLGAIIIIPLMIAGIALAISLIVVSFAGGWVLQDSVFPLMDFIALSGLNIGLIKILALIILLIPVMLLIYAGIRLLFRFKARSKGLVLSLVTIWVIGIFGLASMVGYAFKDYRSGAKLTTKETIATTSDTLYVSIPQNFDKNNTRFYIGWDSEDRHPHIPYLWMDEQEDTMSVFPSLAIYYVDDSTFSISYTRSARAKTKGLARSKVESLPIAYSITDSLVSVAPQQFTKEQKWSGEFGKLVIYAPRNKKVMLDSELENDSRHYHHWDDEIFD